MSIVLYHHPFSRAANVIWMLEEVGAPYELRFVDLMTGKHKLPDILALNPMGKLPILTDGAAVITESAAIGLYLADRYAAGRLAPQLDDPRRGTYLRWSLFPSAVIEPALMAKAAGWTYKEGQAGWGNHESVLLAMQAALADHEYILGNEFSMADMIFGGTVRFMLMFKMLEPLPVFVAYAERLAARPALKKADARNAAVIEQQGIKRG
ncbi:MAG: glutathione S-transferase family protein [Deltaproteobacteria bacterium]